MRLGLPKQITDHEQRDDIVWALLQGQSVRALEREYGIHHEYLNRARKRLMQYIGPVLRASLPYVAPELAAQTDEAKPFTFRGLIDDLSKNDRELEQFKHAPETKPQHFLQAANIQVRIADTKARIGEVVAKYHDDGDCRDQVARIEKALALTLRRVPEADRVFREEWQRISSPLDTANPPGTGEDSDQH